MGGWVKDEGVMGGISMGTNKHHGVRGECVRGVERLRGKSTWGEGEWETLWWGGRRPAGWAEWISGDWGEFWWWRVWGGGEGGGE